MVALLALASPVWKLAAFGLFSYLLLAGILVVALCKISHLSDIDAEKQYKDYCRKTRYQKAHA